MCFATLGLAAKGIKLEDPSCVRKTVPSFFQILAAPPPQVRLSIVSSRTDRVCAGSQSLLWLLRACHSATCAHFVSQGLGVEIWECDTETGERKRRLTEAADLFAAK